jgi:hypothetical protein
MIPELQQIVEKINSKVKALALVIDVDYSKKADKKYLEAMKAEILDLLKTIRLGEKEEAFWHSGDKKDAYIVGKTIGRLEMVEALFYRGCEDGRRKDSRTYERGKRDKQQNPRRFSRDARNDNDCTGRFG